MGETRNKVAGRTKQAVGGALGDRGLQREGRVQEATGKAQGAVKDASRGIEDALGKMGSKLAERRRKSAGTRDREARPERERPRRDVDLDY